MKQQTSEKEKQRQLIKEKIAMQRKEQKIEQKRLLNNIKAQKERQKTESTALMKEQFTNALTEAMNEMVQTIVPKAEENKEESPSEEIGYDESVVNDLVALEIGTREQCIKASKICDDCKDPDCVAEALQAMMENEQNEQEQHT